VLSTLGTACGKEASLDETVGWIKATLTRSYLTEIAGHQRSVSIGLDRLSDCTLKVKTSFGDSTEVSNHEFILVLSELDPSHIRCRQSEVANKTWTFTLSTSNGEKTIKHSYIQTGEVSGNENTLAVMPISVNDENLCLRTTAAFSHAIELCGGKKAPF
jgi:hypothetical protein